MSTVHEQERDADGVLRCTCQRRRVDPRQRLEIVVEQMRVAGQPLTGPEPKWRDLIEVWRLSLRDALDAMPAETGEPT